jgi:cell division protein FtsX
MSDQVTEHIEGLLKPLDGDASPNAWRNRRARAQGSVDDARRSRGAVEESGSPAVEPVKPATTDDIAQVREALEQQNELLQAILASSVDTQTDARSTAQNSRTFAWAGTVIALLTLVATVISIVAAIRAS